MATSSRIFIRGLPPSFSEDEFRRHFGARHNITDARIIPHRRIGYVGFKTPDEATKAVKYFNKTFIRMSKIEVELARPVQDGPSKGFPSTSVADPTALSPASINKRPMDSGVNPSSNLLKRKRGLTEPCANDPRLDDFLDVMQPASRPKTSLDAVPTEVKFNCLETAKTEPLTLELDETRLPKANHGRTKREPSLDKSQAEGQTERLDADIFSKPIDPSAILNNGLDGVDSGTAPPLMPVADADWLRSRTSRLLGLENNEQESSVHSQARPLVNGGAQFENDSEAALVIKGASTHLQQENIEHLESEADEDQTWSERDSQIEMVQSTHRLFVRNLPYSATEDDLLSLFPSSRNVQEVHIPRNPKGDSKGFAYVSFGDSESAIEAFRTLDGTIFQGRLLHLLPARAKTETKLDDFSISQLPLKKQKQIKRRAEAASSSFNWNSMFMSADAILSSVSDRFGVPKSSLLDPTAAEAAVKQAHAETHIIQETKAWFEANGVNLTVFHSRGREDETILVKNFPYGTKEKDLKQLFEKFGEINRLLMPPSGTIAIVGFVQPSHGRAAFSSLAYSRFKDSVLFLEKAPKGIFTQDPVANSEAKDSFSLPQATKISSVDLLHADTHDGLINTSTLFVRNLSFATTTEDLIAAFRSLDGLISARVKTKPDPKRPGQLLSMGFGFLEFRTKENAQSALSAMNGYELNNHRLVIRASHKGLDAAEERKAEDKAKNLARRRTKIIIKNLPFEMAKKDVRSLFGAYGQIRAVRVPKKFDNSARGFAFVDFASVREAQSAMEALKETHLLGRRLVLEFAATDAVDAEEEIEGMQKKVGRQVKKVILQRLTGSGRKKFNINDGDNMDED